jgi:hypothetical protein
VPLTTGFSTSIARTLKNHVHEPILPDSRINSLADLSISINTVHRSLQQSGQPDDSLGGAAYANATCSTGTVLPSVALNFKLSGVVSTHVPLLSSSIYQIAWSSIGGFTVQAGDTLFTASNFLHVAHNVADGTWHEVSLLGGESWIQVALDGEVIATQCFPPALVLEMLQSLRQDTITMSLGCTTGSCAEEVQVCKLVSLCTQQEF